MGDNTGGLLRVSKAGRAGVVLNVGRTVAAGRVNKAGRVGSEIKPRKAGRTVNVIHAGRASRSAGEIGMRTTGGASRSAGEIGTGKVGGINRSGSEARPGKGGGANRSSSKARAGKTGRASRAALAGAAQGRLRPGSARRRHASAQGRRAAARAKQRTAMRRAPRPAPQASSPQAMPASGAGPAPRQTTHPQGVVVPAGREGAAASAGSAKGMPLPAAEHAVQAAGPGDYAAGYRDGVFAGGEALVAQHIPPDHILPAVAAADLIAAGFRQYAPSLTRLTSPHEMAGHIMAALDAQRPLSVVRLGDGELLALAADTVLPAAEVQELAPFLPYAGVPSSTPEIRAMLAEAIQAADWVGVPTSRAPTFQGLLFPVLRHFGIDWSSLKLTSSTINYSLHQSHLLLPILQGRRVLLMGSQATELGALLQQHGIQVTGIVPVVSGMADIPRVMQQTAGQPFDIALVAAGIPAVVLCRCIAGELGKVAIDFGHLADKLVTGELQL
ncbi:hypothetical protein PAECIP112173_03808 [Paenibacillus sp. JJ-100]|nr:hypothetical protein PAECIP112173_03808 [Paenibacillus sp. JJ-100]